MILCDSMETTTTRAIGLSLMPIFYSLEGREK